MLVKNKYWLRGLEIICHLKKKNLKERNNTLSEVYNIYLQTHTACKINAHNYAHGTVTVT